MDISVIEWYLRVRDVVFGIGETIQRPEMRCCKIDMYLSIMDFLRGQYVIYGPVRIILTEDEVWGQYNPNRYRVKSP